MKNTPRDFFLHLGAFATLYFAAIALITLLFRLIDYSFPDPVREQYYYGDPYSGPMRFAIAALLILVPLSLFLLRVIQKEARKHPERHDLGIRRWLTYITLFIAGATIIGDLITLLYSFLGGTLATAFALKAVALLGIMGAAFWYFVLDIRGYWQNRERRSKAVAGGVGAVALASVVAGFFIMGSPMVQREIRFDAQAVQDLQQIQYQVVEYWQRNEALPPSLTALESDITGFRVPVAPAGRAAYRYTASSELGFTLCAEFARDSSERDRISAQYYPGNTYGIVGRVEWNYSAGETCFDRIVDPLLIKPYTAIVQ